MGSSLEQGILLTEEFFLAEGFFLTEEFFLAEGQKDGKYRYSNLFFVYRYFFSFWTEYLPQISIREFKICPIDAKLQLCIDIQIFCFLIDILEQKTIFFEVFYRYTKKEILYRYIRVSFEEKIGKGL